MTNVPENKIMCVSFYWLIFWDINRGWGQLINEIYSSEIHVFT